MRQGLKTKLGFLLAICLIFLADQAVRAEFLCGGSVTGTIVDFYLKSEEAASYAVEVKGDDVGDYVFYGIPVTYLEKVLAECEMTLDGARVTIWYHECPNLEKDNENLKACSIKMDCCENTECTFDLPVSPGRADQTGAGAGLGRGRGPSN